MLRRAGYRIEWGRFEDLSRRGAIRSCLSAPAHKCLSPLEIFIRSNGCKLAQDRYNGAARQLVSVVMVTPSVPPQRLPVNLVRAGRQQPQREHCVPGCGWWGHHLSESSVGPRRSCTEIPLSPSTAKPSPYAERALASPASVSTQGYPLHLVWPYRCRRVGNAIRIRLNPRRHVPPNPLRVA